MYQWIMKRKGFKVSNVGFFLYVDGQHLEKSGMIDSSNPLKSYMEFNNAIIPYNGNDDWVEGVLRKIKKGIEDCVKNPSGGLRHNESHSPNCELGAYLSKGL